MRLGTDSRSRHGYRHEARSDAPSLKSFNACTHLLLRMHNECATHGYAVINQPIVETRHQSFLDADPKSTVFSEVTHILLDPSCSASGMSQTPTTDPADLKQLAEDQEALILHALSFPKLEALVYSTCSIHDAENEEVVKKVLKLQAAK